MADDKQKVSMLDLQVDTEEIMGFNPEADANAMLPPVPKGRYAVTVKFENDNPDERFIPALWGKGANEQKVLYTNVVATIYNAGELADGRTVRDMINTYTSRGTNSMQGVLQALGYGEQLRGVPKTRSALALMLSEALASDAAPAEVDIDWEATEKLTEEEREQLKAAGKKAWRIQGMTRFEKDTDGNHIPEYEYKGATCRAYNIIDRWITASATGAVAQPAQTAPPQPAARAPQAVRQSTPAPATQAPTQAPKPAQAPAGGPPVPAGAGQRQAARMPGGAPVPAGRR